MSDYDTEPVLYCRDCLSLRIMDVGGMTGTDFCEDCGSTDIAMAPIGDWDEMYQRKYGKRFVDT